jgi:hypothetical protein
LHVIQPGSAMGRRVWCGELLGDQG